MDENKVMYGAIISLVLILGGFVVLLFLLGSAQSNPDSAFYVDTSNATHAAYQTLKVQEFYRNNHADNATLLFNKTVGTRNDKPMYSIAFTFNDTESVEHIATMTMFYTSINGYVSDNDGWGNAIIVYERV